MSRYRSTRLPATSAQSAPIRDAIDDFIAHHERKGDSPRYITELRSYLIGGTQRFGVTRPWQPLVPWSLSRGTARVNELSKGTVSDYLSDVRATATRNTYGKLCGILQLLFAFWVKEGIIASEPLRIERPKRLKAEIKVFTTDEVERLRQVVAKENARDWAIFMLLLDTGMRASELCNLRFDDIRWERKEVIIRPQIAKNRTFRIIPLYGCMRALRRYRLLRGDSTEGCDALFLSFFVTPVFASGGKRRNLDKVVFCNASLTRNGLFFLVKKWGQLANVTESRCSPHTFRHYFATQYLRLGGNILSLQRILGHSRLDITERYLRYGHGDVKAEHERFSPAIAMERQAKFNYPM